jgi:hypothetical protein
LDVVPKEEEEEEEEGVIIRELTCALCHDVFVDPVRAPCGHPF